MALNVNRWLQYAKARIDSAVGSGHAELDRLEAQQEAERADKPWLASDGAAPTFDEARARIAWEADQQAKKAAAHERQKQDERVGFDADRAPGDLARGEASDDDAAPTGAAGSPSVDSPASGPTIVGPGPKQDDPVTDDLPKDQASDHAAPSEQPAEAGPAPRSPQQIAHDAELETARLEMEDRQRQSVERLAQIRQELGIDEPPAP